MNTTRYKIPILQLESFNRCAAKVRLKVINKTNGIEVFRANKIGKVTAVPYLVDFESEVLLEDLQLIVEYNRQVDYVRIGDIEQI